MEELVKSLVTEGALKTREIVEAFTAVDRKDFVLPEYSSEAYINAPLSIGYGQTISQPYTVAFMFELLEPKKGEKILDVGSGSGWTTALLAHVVGPRGSIIGVELIPELAKFGSKNLAKYDFKHASIEQAGKELGKPKEAPFNKILVSAGGEEVPQELVDQLKIGGVMVIPILDAIWKVTKVSESETNVEKFEGFVFVPLLHD